MSEGKRAPRLGLPTDAVTVTGSVPVNDIPGRARMGQRRWQDLGQQVIATSTKNEALVIEVGAGYRLDVVRSGLNEELKRHNYRLKSQTIKNGDGSYPVYLVAEPAGEAQESDSAK